MPFIIPTFNLSVNIWHNEDPTITWPIVRAPDVNVNGNLHVGRKYEGGGVWSMHLAVPVGTDIRDDNAGGGTAYEIVEVPAGTGRFYVSEVVDDVGRGFGNEYRLATILKVWMYFGATTPWPVPIP